MTKLCGIYCFENKINGKKYVGQSQDIKGRIRGHKHSFRKNKDACLVLKRAWDKYGEENFKIYILELCSVEMLEEREIFWIKELKSHISEWGYNVSFGGEAPMRGLHHSEETKRRISENAEDRNGEKNPMYGKSVSDEIKAKISHSLKIHFSTNSGHSLGKKFSEESRKRMSDAQLLSWQTNEHRKESAKHKKGKPFSENVKDELSKIKCGVKISKNSSSKYVGVSLEENGRWHSYIYFKKNV